MNSTIPASVQYWIDTHADLIESWHLEDDGYSDNPTSPLAIWLYLAEGYVCDATECHTVHAATAKDFFDDVSTIHLCDCEECRKANAEPVTDLAFTKLQLEEIAHRIDISINEPDHWDNFYGFTVDQMRAFEDRINKAKPGKAILIRVAEAYWLREESQNGYEIWTANVAYYNDVNNRTMMNTYRNLNEKAIRALDVTGQI